MNIISPAGSFAGYSFSTWFVKNKDTLKLIVVGTAALGSFLATEHLTLDFRLVAIPLITATSKLIVDSIDFLASNVVLK